MSSPCNYQTIGKIRWDNMGYTYFGSENNCMGECMYSICIWFIYIYIYICVFIYTVCILTGKYMDIGDGTIHHNSSVDAWYTQPHVVYCVYNIYIFYLQTQHISILHVNCIRMNSWCLIDLTKRVYCYESTLPSRKRSTQLAHDSWLHWV